MQAVIQQPCEVREENEAKDEADKEAETEDGALVASLMAQLECPVCYEVNEPPIFMCLNGHNVCYICKEMMGECATCRLPGQPEIRNRFAEATYERLTVPCEHAGRGCPARTLPHRRLAHALVCRRAPVACVLCGFAGGGGRVDELLAHIGEAHPEVCRSTPAGKWRRKAALEPYRRVSAVVHDDGALLWFSERYDAAADAFAFQIFKAGPADAPPSEYVCAVRFVSYNCHCGDCDELRFTFAVPHASSFSADAERAVSGNALRSLAPNDALTFTVAVRRRDEPRDRGGAAAKVASADVPAADDGDGFADTAYCVLVPLLLVFAIGCIKGWWVALLRWL